MEHLFETYLTQRKLSPNTIKSYNYSRELFFSLYPRLTQRNLEQYKLYLLETYRPQTVNLRIRGINCYLEFCGKRSIASTCSSTPFSAIIVSHYTESKKLSTQLF